MNLKIKIKTKTLTSSTDTVILILAIAVDVVLQMSTAAARNLWQTITNIDNIKLIIYIYTIIITY